MHQLNVLMIGNDTSVKGGITSVITQILNHDWNADGIHMQFIPTYIDKGIIRKALFFMNSYSSIFKTFKNQPPDVVHIHMSYKGSFIRKYIIYRLCQKEKIPVIVHLHGSEFEKWFYRSRQKERIRKFLREITALIVLGDKWNEAIKKIEPKANTIIVKNTVNIPKETTKWKDSFQVLFLGALIKRKGVADLLSAIQLMKSAGNLNHNIHFIIAGSGTEESTLLAQCQKTNICEYVDFIGWVNQEHRARLLKESQLLVLPSYNEGLPMAILEAISYGLPIIATDVGDISSAVKHGKNGYLINPGDTTALYKAIVSISSDKKKYETMRTVSRAIAEKDFSNKKYFAQLAECYHLVAYGTKK